MHHTPAPDTPAPCCSVHRSYDAARHAREVEHAPAPRPSRRQGDRHHQELQTIAPAARTLTLITQRAAARYLHHWRYRLHALEAWASGAAPDFCTDVFVGLCQFCVRKGLVPTAVLEYRYVEFAKLRITNPNATISWKKDDKFNVEFENARIGIRRSTDLNRGPYGQVIPMDINDQTTRFALGSNITCQVAENTWGWDDTWRAITMQTARRRLVSFLNGTQTVLMGMPSQGRDTFSTKVLTQVCRPHVAFLVAGLKVPTPMEYESIFKPVHEPVAT